MKKNHIVTLICLFVIFYISNRLSYIFSLTPDTNILLRVNLVFQNISQYFFGLISLQVVDLVVGIATVIFLLLIMEIKSTGKKNFRKGIEYGSAEWGTKKDIAPFLSKNKRNRILLSDTESIMINEEPDNPKYRRNRNVVVIGGAGSGKSRYVLKPNLLQLNSSYVITDPKGEMLRDTGDMFRRKGYKLKVFNTINLLNTLSYNAFSYIKTESDILKFIDYLIANTSDPKKTGGDEFWVNAEKLLYMAYIGLMLETCSPDEFNFTTLIRLVNLSQVDEDNPDKQNIVDMLFKEHAADFPDSFAVSQYKKYKLAAGKTAKSILIQVGTRLAPFDIKEVRDATKEDDLDLAKLGDEKTVLFLLVSDTSPTFNFLVGMLYSQMFNILIEHADQRPNGRLKYSVQCMLDEFANIGKIPNFEKLIATIRSRGISTVIFLQTLSQLKATYEKEADTIIGNCDTQIFLGGKDGTTLKEISESLGKETVDLVNRNLSYGQHKSWSDNNSSTGRELLTTSEISILDNSLSIINIRGVKPFLSKKIKLENHPNYHLLAEDESDGKQFNLPEYILEFKKNKMNTHDKPINLVAKNKAGTKESYNIRQNDFDPNLNFKKIAGKVIHVA